MKERKTELSHKHGVGLLVFNIFFNDIIELL